MYILGIYNAHNATAAILKDGKVIACVSEERFTNVKNQYGFPKHAIDYCIKAAGIESKDLDLVTIPFKYGAPQHSLRENAKDMKLAAALYVYKIVGVIRSVWGELAYRYPSLMPIGKTSFRIASIAFEKYHMASERKFVAEYLGLPIDKVVTFDHHETHAISSYFTSPFNGQKALVLTLDGEGDFKCATATVFDGKKHKLLASTDREHSLGYIYQKLTEYLGMKKNEHEYKVMGLAPYAKDFDIDKTYKKISDLVTFDQKDQMRFTSKFNTLDTEKFLEREMRRTRFDILAGAFQKLVEEKTVEWVRYCMKKTKMNTVILSGGVFMNVKVNQKIAEMPEVRKLYILPSCGDESTPVGAALLGFIKLKNLAALKNAVIDNIYWGPEFGSEDIEKALKKKGLSKRYLIKKPKDIEKRIAALLARGEIVARMAGRMEFGARALGNRTIMANASNVDVIKKINEQIKGRDFWMPFAPSILWERMSDYVINPKKILSPYMMLGFETTALAHKELIAGLHAYDLTARPQFVTKDGNPKYHKILKEFERLTGIGGILNTSFNLHGFPIVLGPSEALEVFEKSGLKYLALEDFLVEKRKKAH